MRRADRLFDIIQRLRTATGPVTAATLSTVPIEGAPGIGYLFRRGFDLPPLMFTADEVEAIAVGARLLRRTGDAGLQSAAASLLSKISVILPPDTRPRLDDPAMFVSGFGVAAMPEADLALVRAAIRNRRKLRIGYADSTGRRTRRTIRPVAIAYYVQATLVAGWCETRRDYRHFRTDRIRWLSLLDATFDDADGRLAAGWRELPRFGPDGAQRSLKALEPTSTSGAKM